MQVASTYEPHLMTNRAVRGAIRPDITKLNNEGDK